MIRLRKANDRGAVSMGWLNSKHTFSFGHYHDPAHMGFGNLRVINEDRVQPGKGFAPHSHENMEIISYVISGALEHKDSMGNGSVIRPGDVQRMSAGTGVQHSEFNHSEDEPVHFLQIWVLPDSNGLQPAYQERHFSPERRRNQLRLVASREGRDESLTVHQDVDLYASLLSAGNTLTHVFGTDRNGWIQLVHGRLTIGDQVLAAGDGAAIGNVETIEIEALEDAELLLFDMAGA